jgi:hypothetical protein
VDAAEELAGILYPPALTAPAPIIWLPNDSAGVARSEAYDLQHYHHLAVTIDVRTRNGDTNVHVATQVAKVVEHCAHIPNNR